jgi:hypothetical protein
MSIEFRCTACREILTVPDEAAGRQARCPKCDAMMPIPAVSPEASPVPNFSDFPSDQSSSKPAISATDIPHHTVPSELNPYASPAAVDEIDGPNLIGGTPLKRAGLPWDDAPRGFSAWKRTMTLVMLSPGVAFSRMRIRGGVVVPFRFAALGVILGYFAVCVWLLPVRVFLDGIPLIPRHLDTEGLLWVLLAAVVGLAIWLTILLPIMVLIGLSTLSVIHHSALRLIGAGKGGFEATFRVNAYSVGSLAWIAVIPFVGHLIAFVIAQVCAAIGFSKAHDTTFSKALIAALTPLALLIAAWFAVFIYVFLVFNNL